MSPQLRACDRCTQGVMDTTNDHARGLCPCPCHEPTAQQRAQTRGICDTCGQTYVLLPSGKMPRHRNPWRTAGVCKGSNKPPEHVVSTAAKQ